MVIAYPALTAPTLPVAGTPASAFGVALGSVLSQAASVGLVWMLVTVIVAAVPIVAVPRSVRGIRTDAVSDPDLAFAVGFLAVFGLLVTSALPLFVGTSLGYGPLVTIGLVVATPGLLACAALLVGGGCLGAIVVGDRLGRRLGAASPSLWQSLAVGTLALGASQLVPVLGTVATVVAATVGSGALVSSGYEARWGEPPLVASSSPGEPEPSPGSDSVPEPVPSVPSPSASTERDRLTSADWRLEDDVLDVDPDERPADETARGGEESTAESVRSADREPRERGDGSDTGVDDRRTETN